jgi:glucosamine-6-phosphate deaminase
LILSDAKPKSFQIEKLKVEVYPTSKAAGGAAARAVAEELVRLSQTRDSIGVIFATGASQIETLEALTAMEGLPWERVRGFHMDEYVGIAADHPASFRRYMRERVSQKVPLMEFHGIEGDAPDLEGTRRRYADELRSADPQLCLLGIGENGHIAFNDPHVADFQDPEDLRIVHLDAVCREQQIAEGWFASADQVPESAITLTIPALMRVPRLIVPVPGHRKTSIVRRTLFDPISTSCPATILRTHPNVTIFLDEDSASELNDVPGM